MPKLLDSADDAHPREWIKPYYKSFNGLRAVAVFGVFLHHYSGFWHDWLHAYDWGWTGVDLFFVLSGFLITGILYDALEDPHFFRNFYVRRALRIFPIFYGFFFLLFLLTPILHLHYDWTLLGFFFYVGNLMVPFLNLARHNPTLIMAYRHGFPFEAVNIGHLWSLCVEEQFYLLWPSVVWVVRDRRRLMQVCVVLSAAALLGRIVIELHLRHTVLPYPFLIHWSIYTRCDTLLIGAWMALWLRGRKLTTIRLRRISLWLFLLPAIALAGGLWVVRPSANFLLDPFLCTIGYTLIALSFAGILLRSLDETGFLSRALQLWPLRAFGMISYGFYFFHMLPEDVLGRFGILHRNILPLMPVVAFVCSTGLAALSFHFYESPFLRLKNRWAPGHRSVPSGDESVEAVA